MGRPYRGSRLSTFYADLDLDSASVLTNDSQSESALSSFESAFQLQEYISALVRLNPHDVERIVRIPGRAGGGGISSRSREKASEDGGVDEACWIYEQLRRLAQDLTYPLLVSLQQECSRQTCPEMKAGEWLYLCVAHGSSGAMEHCCAIDYAVHTLDSATALLNSPRAFPSRLSIPTASHRHFPSLARRLGRIFAHAYFHHRAIFAASESENSLYARFLALSRRFDLVPAEFLVIPPQDSEEEISRELPKPEEKPVAVLTHEKQGSEPVTGITSRSPRMSGRSRTDTMYLSGPFVSDSPTQRRVPSPLAATLANEEEEKRQDAALEVDVAAEDRRGQSSLNGGEGEERMELDLPEPPPGLFVHDIGLSDDTADGDEEEGDVAQEVEVRKEEASEEASSHSVDKPSDLSKPEEPADMSTEAPTPSESTTLNSPISLTQSQTGHTEAPSSDDAPTSYADMLKGGSVRFDPDIAPSTTQTVASETASTPESNVLSASSTMSIPDEKAIAATPAPEPAPPVSEGGEEKEEDSTDDTAEHAIAATPAPEPSLLVSEGGEENKEDSTNDTPEDATESGCDAETEPAPAVTPSEENEKP